MQHLYYIDNALAIVEVHILLVLQIDEFDKYGIIASKCTFTFYELDLR
jgi:hypothetical protein